MSKPNRYFIDYDNSSHKYLIPLNKKTEWDVWNSLSEDDPNSWEAPDFAERLEGEFLTFEKPELDGKQV